MTDEEMERVARGRLGALTLARMLGFAIIFVGFGIYMKNWIEPSHIIGPVLIAVGLIDVIVVPIVLLRRWRTPREP